MEKPDEESSHGPLPPKDADCRHYHRFQRCQLESEAARKLRHRVKQELNATLNGERFAGKRWDLVNPWSSEKDGKAWFGSRHPDSMRK